MLYYYPSEIPKHVDKTKLDGISNKTYRTTMLYSNEGMFQIQKGKLYSVHFNDDIDSKKITIDNKEYMSDKTEIIWKLCDKLPYEFLRRDINVFCYEKGSIKMYLEESDNSIIHMYFFVKDSNIHGIHDDIQELMRKVLKASF